MKLKPIAAIGIAGTALLLALDAAEVSAQNSAQDAIDRNLLIRQQQEQDFQNRLGDPARNATQPGPVLPPPSLGDSIAPPPLPQVQLPPRQRPPADLQSLQLYQSQQQRLLEEQSRNQLLPAPLKQQQNQLQLQQFQREDQAQRLQQDIQHNPIRVVPGVR